MISVLKLAAILSTGSLCCGLVGVTTPAQAIGGNGTARQPGVIEKTGPNSAILREGTPISLTFVEPLNSGSAAIGNRVQFVLARNMENNGSIIARAGSRVSAEVIEVKRAAPPGRSGAITLRLDGLRTEGITIKLRGSSERTGPSDVQYRRNNDFKFPFGLLRPGNNVKIKTGTLLTVFVAEDVSLSVPR
jgi:hypothetical protein